MPTKKITEQFAATAPANANYWDTSLPGFALFCGKNARTWFYQRDVDGRTTRTRIGRYPAVSHKAARAKAMELAAAHMKDAAPEKPVGVWTVEQALNDCHHPWVDDIDKHLVLRDMTLAKMAEKYDVHGDALMRHRDTHISDEARLEIMQAAKAESAERHAEIVNGERSDIEKDMLWVVGEIKGLINRAKAGEDDMMALAGLKEVGRALERLAKLYGLLENRVSVEMSIHDSPQFLRLRETILNVLERHPDAKADFLGEMKKLQVLDAPRLANR